MPKPIPVVQVYQKYTAYCAGLQINPMDISPFGKCIVGLFGVTGKRTTLKEIGSKRISVFVGLKMRNYKPSDHYQLSPAEAACYMAESCRGCFQVNSMDENVQDKATVFQLTKHTVNDMDFKYAITFGNDSITVSVGTLCIDIDKYGFPQSTPVNMCTVQALSAFLTKLKVCMGK